MKKIGASWSATDRAATAPLSFALGTTDKEKVKRDPLRERRELRRLLSSMPRTKKQRHGFFQSDAEILRWDARTELIVSTDGLSEEIACGLYRDPATWGWICVMNSVSDLAATGAQGLGILLTTEWGRRVSLKDKRRFFVGAEAALRTARLPLLGGDSGTTDASTFTSTVLGRSRGPALTRLGARPGDRVLLCGRGRTGAGPALAQSFLSGTGGYDERYFRPRPSWIKTHELRGFARASIDTSDGLLIALATLAELNNVGFDLTWRPETLEARAARFFKRCALPLELLWTGDLGDLQTLLIVPASKARELTSKNRDLIELGAARRTPGLSLTNGTETHDLPVDLILESGRDLRQIRLRQDRLARFFAPIRLKRPSR